MPSKSKHQVKSQLRMAQVLAQLLLSYWRRSSLARRRRRSRRRSRRL